ncbi:MAG: hypothetical protein D6750_11060 [Bacteroidetes bacterium]|nr:MAG: hypothetical protein D6750_11060 [Bacteroidota bacterium]
MRLSEDDKIRFVRGVILQLQQEVDKSQEGFVRHLWDAFIRPETLHPQYQRAPSVLHIKLTKEDERTGKIRPTRHGDPEKGGVRNVGAFEGFANLLTAPIRATTALVLAHTAQGKTFGRESGTPTQVGSFAETYAADPSWGSVLEAHFPNLHPALRIILGGVGNIALDPLNLLGLGPVQKAMRGVSEAGSALKRLPQVAPKPLQQPSQKAVELVNNAQKALRNAKIEIEYAANKILETNLLKNVGRSDEPSIFDLFDYFGTKEDLNIILQKYRKHSFPANRTEFRLKNPSEFETYQDYIRYIIPSRVSDLHLLFHEQIKRETRRQMENIPITPLFKLFRLWKLSKTAYNMPASGVRNFLQNFIYRWLTGDISSAEIGKGIYKTISEALTKEGRERIKADIETIRAKEVATEPEVYLLRGDKGLLRLHSYNDVFDKFAIRNLELGRLNKFGEMTTDKEKILAILKQLGERTTDKQELLARLKRLGRTIHEPLVRWYNTGDIIAARIMAQGAAKKGEDITRLTELFIPDYARVPALFRSLSLTFMPFANWLWYALYGSARGIRRVPHRWAKMLDMLYSGGLEADVPPKDKHATREFVSIPLTGKEINAGIITPFELGAGSELPLWTLEQIPAVNIYREFDRQKREGKTMLEASMNTAIKSLLPPTLHYYLPNIISPQPPRSPRSRLTRSQLDYLLGFFGIPIRPEDKLYDTKQKIQETKKEMRQK